jgi:hypothetical protein
MQTSSVLASVCIFMALHSYECQADDADWAGHRSMIAEAAQAVRNSDRGRPAPISSASRCSRRSGALLAVDDFANPLHKSEPLRARTLPNVPADEYASETYFEGSLYSLHDIGTATT